MTMKGANFLEKLLDGQKVEWKKLGEVAENLDNLRRPVTGNNRVAGEYPYYGASGIVDYVDNYIFDGDYLLISEDGANLTARKTPIAFSISGKNWVNNHAHVLKFETYVERKFVEYYLNNLDISEYVSGAAQPKLNQANLNRIPIPIPPLSVQSRIVEILDKFTSLEAELEAELDCRKRQYIYYRERLLDFSEENKGFKVEWKKLGEVCGVLRGRRLTKKELSQEKQGFAVYHGGIEPIGYYPTANRKANSTMVINVGASAGTVGFSREKFWSSDGCFCFTESPILLQRFLFYYLQSIEHKVKSKVRVAGIPTLDANILYNLEIPLPPLSVQSRIVEILDKFDTLTNSISEGLPLEIQLRRQQYEYYREQLLDFRR